MRLVWVEIRLFRVVCVHFFQGNTTLCSFAVVHRTRRADWNVVRHKKLRSALC